MFETPSFTGKSFGWGLQVLEGGVLGGAYQVMSAPSFTGKSFGWGSQVLGACFTIMMCNVFGGSFGG